MTAWETHHNPERITWELGRTNWLHETPLAFGTIPSSDTTQPDHNICVRTDGSNPSCGCKAGKDCTIERHGEECARAFWAAWAREPSGTT
jgi:hypothetical protein